MFMENKSTNLEFKNKTAIYKNYIAGGKGVLSRQRKGAIMS